MRPSQPFQERVVLRAYLHHLTVRVLARPEVRSVVLAPERRLVGSRHLLVEDIAEDSGR